MSLAACSCAGHSMRKSNADTIQQRCRFFGYKRNYLNSCRVFIPLDSTIEYREYVKHEEIMRNMLNANTLERAEQLLILDSSMNPTRNNILSADVVSQKLSGWRQMNALQQIEENISFVSNFLSSQTFTDFTNFGTPDRNHRYVKLEIEKIIEFLKDFKVMNMPDALRKSSTIQYLRYLADKQELKYAYIFEMSYAVVNGRERSLDSEKDVFKIKNIFSGPSTSGTQTYPGDKGIRFDNSFCIQIHKIKLKHSSMQWGNKVLYTLGMYYPEDFAHSFVGVGK